MKTRKLGVLVALAIVSASSAWAVTYTYTGGGVDPNKWDDPANWGGSGYPWSTGPEADAAIIPDGFGPSFNTVSPYLQRLQTGNMLVTLPSSVTMTYNSSGGWHAGIVDIGTGGLTVNGGIGFGNWGEAGFFSAGPVTMTYLQMNSATPTQTGGYYDIGTIQLQGNGTGQVRAWTIHDADNTTITSYAHNGSNHEWVGNPILDGRPNWDLVDAGVTWNPSGGKWNLKNYTLYGNRLRIDGGSAGGGAGNLYPDYLVSNGGTVDVNRIEIGTGASNNRRSYMALSNTTIHVRGTATAWDNNSTNNVRFDVTTSTVHFVPTGGALSVRTGSKDAGGGPAAFTDNFAFGNVVIGSGATVTLTGANNIDGGASALYVKGALSGAGTINGDGRNVYVDGSLSPGTSPGTLTLTNANLFLTPNIQLNYELGPTDAFGIGYVGMGSNDLVQVFGDLTLDGTLNVTFLPGRVATYGSTNVYRLFDYTGTVTDNGLALDPSLRFAWLEVDTVNKDVNLYLLNVPEPSTVLLFMAGGWLLWRWRRRR